MAGIDPEAGRRESEVAGFGDAAREEDRTLARWQIGAVSLDCADHKQLGMFYSRLLDTDIVFETDGLCALRVGPVLLAVKGVPNYSPPTWPDPSRPQQEHLDFVVDDLDTAEVVALEAGATKAAVQPAPNNWRVMIDPAGHPFCLNAHIPDW
jgi:Glyoxalase-like domain